MRIKKKLLEKVLIEANEEEKTDLSQINPSEDSVSEIADAIQDTVDEISDGKTEVSDAAAKSAAKEIKDTATEINAGSVALDDSIAENDFEYVGVENRLTRILDKALRTANTGRRQGFSKNANVLITGLPGSGKTSIIFDWAYSKGINVYNVSAADPDLEAAVYGLTLRDVTAADKNKTTKATSNFLDKLDRENSVLFLDEFNRANSKLRRALLMLVNEHCVNDSSYPNGLRPFKNLLFTVAAVNPGGLKTDRNADSLNDAEKSRFALKIADFDSSPEVSVEYFTKSWDNRIAKLDKNDPYYLHDLKEYLFSQDLGIYIVSHPDFAYDKKDKNDTLDDKGKTMLNQRELTDGLNIAEGDVLEFREWVQYESDFLDEDIEMLLKILNTYKVPTFEELLQKKLRTLSIDLENTGLDPKDKAVNTNTNTSIDNTDGSEEIEQDENFFGSADMSNSPIPQGVENSVNDWMANF